MELPIGPMEKEERGMGRKARDAKRGVLAELSQLELEVMDVVWRLGECNSAAVIDAYANRRDLAPSTIRTVLGNLRRKGYLLAVPSLERGFRLRPAVDRDLVARRRFPSLILHLFGGSPRQAIAYLLQQGDLDARELEEIRALIDARRGRKSS